MEHGRKPHVLILMFRIVISWFRRLWNPDLLILEGPYEANRSRELGRGTYGSVCLGRNIETNEQVAIKIVKVSVMTGKFVERELQLLAKCDHTHIIKLLWSEKGNDSRYFVLEYCIHGNLNTFIKDREISLGLCVKFMLNIAQAVDYLHKKHICHRDIKPPNILVSEDDGYFLKLADFGLARYFPESSTGIPASLNTGTLGWMAPEVHDNSGLATRYNKSADIFSLGLLFLALVRHEFGTFLEPFTVNGRFLGTWMGFHSEGGDVPVPAIGDRADKRIELIHHMLVFRPDQRYRMPDVCEKLNELPRTEERVTRCASTTQPNAPPRLASRIRTPARTRTRAFVLVSVLVLLLALAAGIYLTGNQARDERCEDIWSRLDINSLERTLKTNLYGQHLAVDAIVQSFREHTKHPRPESALMLSMHGDNGVGKSYATRMIAEHLYEAGYDSPFVHVVKAVDDHVVIQQIHRFQSKEMIKWLQGNVSVCSCSLFIFDKADFLPVNLLPDMKRSLRSDFKDSIFIFENHYGSYGIKHKTFEHYKAGGKRKDINLKSITELKQTAEETFSVWNSWMSENLFSAYVLYLPLERKHLLRCLHDAFRFDEILLELSGYTKSTFFELVVARYNFVRVKSTQFSASGCRHAPENVLAILQEFLYGNKISKSFITPYE